MTASKLTDAQRRVLLAFASFGPLLTREWFGKEYRAAFDEIEAMGLIEKPAEYGLTAAGRSALASAGGEAE